jgi:hypothetical protein
MPAALSLVLVFTILFGSPSRAQSPGLELQAGVGYARVFDAGGISFAAALERSLSPEASVLQHALGGSFWYAHTGIASAPNDPEGRHLVGVGMRYQMALRHSSSFKPFLAVPVQLLHSRIPDRTDLVSAALVSRIPEPPPSRPLEDHVGGAWGWGTGLELGFRLGSGKRLSAQTSLQAMYQDIYGSGTRNGAWSWHAGLTYALRGS